jgi:hypothetical protein
MAANLSNNFLDEASQIYDRERDVDRLTTIAATSIMSVTLKGLGKDEAGYHLQYESVGMATRLGLYAGLCDPSHSPLDLRNDKIKKATSAVAWESFNFQMQILPRSSFSSRAMLTVFLGPCQWAITKSHSPKDHRCFPSRARSALRFL